MNVFVFHAHDSQGCALAALLRLCDTDLRFQYLPVESPDSVRHMQQFLVKQRLTPEAVGLPFIVLVQPSPNREDHRSVVHGKPLVKWQGELITAVITAPVQPEGLSEAILSPFLPQTLQLIMHAMGITTIGPSTAEEPCPQPAAPVERSQPINIPESQANTPKISVIKTPPDTTLDAPEDENEEEDGMVWSTSEKQQGGRREKTVNIAAVMAQSKERENMNPQGSRQRWT